MTNVNKNLSNSRKNSLVILTENQLNQELLERKGLNNENLTNYYLGIFWGANISAFIFYTSYYK